VECSNTQNLSLSWDVVEEVTLSAKAQTITFSNLSINRDGVYLLYFNIDNYDASGNNSIFLYANGDETATDYYTHCIYANPSIDAWRQNLNMIFTTNNDAGIGEAIIMLDANGHVKILAEVNYTAPLTMSTQRFVVEKSDSSEDDITSLTIKSTYADGINIGSKFVLCRPKRGG